MALVSPDSLARAQGSCRGSSYCCQCLHTALSHCSSNLIASVCPSFLPWRFFEASSNQDSVFVFTFLSSTWCSPMSPQSRPFEVSLGPSIVTADSQSSLSVCRAVSGPQNANGPKRSWLTFDDLLWLLHRVLHFLTYCTSLLSFFLVKVCFSFKFQRSQLLWMTDNSIFNQITNGFLNLLPLLPWYI